MTDEFTDVPQMEAVAPEVEVNNDMQETEHQVPLEALKQERAQRQQLQEEMKMLKDHVALMQMRSQPQQSPPKQEFEGLSDDDVLTVGEFKKALSSKERQYQMNIEELKMTQKHPDYREVISNYLPDVLKGNPSLRRSLEATQDYELAYYLAKNSDAYKSATKQTKKSQEAERILSNTMSSGSLGSVGKAVPKSSVSNWKTMSDQEFMSQAQKNLGYL